MFGTKPELYITHNRTNTTKYLLVEIPPAGLLCLEESNSAQQRSKAITSLPSMSAKGLNRLFCIHPHHCTCIHRMTKYHL